LIGCKLHQKTNIRKLPVYRYFAERRIFHESQYSCWCNCWRKFFN